jgi:hypothetical protein
VGCYSDTLRGRQDHKIADRHVVRTDRHIDDRVRNIVGNNASTRRHTVNCPRIALRVSPHVSQYATRGDGADTDLTASDLLTKSVSEAAHRMLSRRVDRLGLDSLMARYRAREDDVARRLIEQVGEGCARE